MQSKLLRGLRRYPDAVYEYYECAVEQQLRPRLPLPLGTTMPEPLAAREREGVVSPHRRTSTNEPVDPVVRTTFVEGRTASESRASYAPPVRGGKPSPVHPPGAAGGGSGGAITPPMSPVRQVRTRTATNVGIGTVPPARQRTPSDAAMIAAAAATDDAFSAAFQQAMHHPRRDSRRPSAAGLPTEAAGPSATPVPSTAEAATPLTPAEPPAAYEYVDLAVESARAAAAASAVAEVAAVAAASAMAPTQRPVPPALRSVAQPSGLVRRLSTMMASSTAALSNAILPAAGAAASTAAASTAAPTHAGTTRMWTTWGEQYSVTTASGAAGAGAPSSAGPASATASASASASSNAGTNSVARAGSLGQSPVPSVSSAESHIGVPPAVPPPHVSAAAATEDALRLPSVATWVGPQHLSGTTVPAATVATSETVAAAIAEHTAAAATTSAAAAHGAGADTGGGGASTGSAGSGATPAAIRARSSSLTSAPLSSAASAAGSSPAATGSDSAKAAGPSDVPQAPTPAPPATEARRAPRPSWTLDASALPGASVGIGAVSNVVGAPPLPVATGAIAAKALLAGGADDDEAGELEEDEDEDEEDEDGGGGEGRGSGRASPTAGIDPLDPLSIKSRLLAERQQRQPSAGSVIQRRLTPPAEETADTASSNGSTRSDGADEDASARSSPHSGVLHPPLPRSLPPRSLLPVLIVEDNPVNQMIMKHLITKRLHLPCRVADNGRAALTMWSECDFSIMFMDLQMPVMDGLTATREIRRLERQERRRRSIIIATTGLALREDQAAALAAGCDEFLPKPVDMDQLEKRIPKWLEMP